MKGMETEMSTTTLRRTTWTTLAALAALVAIALVALASLAQAAPRDRNHDGLPDSWEKKNHLSLSVNQSKKDQDRDGLMNKAEFQAGTNPRDKDSDDDGINDSREDSDHDGLTNRQEQGRGTNCGDKDSNDDGIADANELENATVKSFDGTTLVLTVGTTEVTVLVDPAKTVVRHGTTADIKAGVAIDEVHLAPGTAPQTALDIELAVETEPGTTTGTTTGGTTTTVPDGPGHK